MATRRMLSKSISLSEQVSRLSDAAALLYSWAILHTDDWGVIHASPVRLRAEVAPLRDHWSVKDVAGYIDEWEVAGLVVRYCADGEPYVLFPTFDKHQDGIHKRTRKNALPNPCFPEEYTITECTPGTSRKIPEVPASRAPAELNRTELNRSKDSAAFAAEAEDEPEQTDPEQQPKHPRTQALETCLAAFGLTKDDLPGGRYAGYAKAMNKLIESTSIEQLQSWADAAMAEGGRVLGTGAKPEVKVPKIVREEVTAEAWQQTFSAAREKQKTAGQRFIDNPTRGKVYERDWSEGDKMTVEQYQAHGMWDAERGMATDDPRHPTRKHPAEA